MTVRAGKMRQVVRFMQRSPVKDSVGEPELTWLLFAERRAEQVKTPGSELWASEQEAARVPTVFKLRPLVVAGAYVDLALLPSMRLICQGKLYQIKSAIDPSGMNEELLITAEEWTETTP